MSALLVALIALPLIGAIAATAAPSRRAAAHIATGASVATLIASALVALEVRSGGIVETLGLLRADALSAIEMMLAAAITTAVSVFQAFDDPTSAPGHDDAEDPGATSAPLAEDAIVAPSATLALLAAAGFAFLAPDLDHVVIGLWLVALASATLVASEGTRAAVRTAWTLLVFAAIGLGLALLGTLTLSAEAAGSTPIGVGGIPLGCILTLVGFATTAAAAPLHGWLTAIHGAVRPSTLAAIAGISVNASLYAALRLHALAPLAEGGDRFGRAVLLFGASAAAIGAVGMLVSSSWRRLLARSTAAYAGVVLLAAACGPLGAAAAVLLIVGYTLARVALLLAGSPSGAEPDQADQDATAPVTVGAPAGLTILAVLAVMGLPPSGVFAGQLTALQAALSRGAWTFAGLLTIFIVSGAALVRGYRELSIDRGDAPGEANPMPVSARMTIAALLLVTATLGVIVPGPVAELFRSASTAIAVGDLTDNSAGSTTAASTEEAER